MPLRDHLETIADDLRDPEYALELLQLGWSDGMPTFLVSLRNLATVNIGMAKLAEITGISSESIYKELSPTGNPRLETIRKILHALNYDLKLENSFAVSQVAEGDEARADTVLAEI